MGIFGGSGKSRDEIIAESAELNMQPEDDKKSSDEVSTGNQKIDIELTKVKGRLEGLDEVRKANSDRFSRISEQIGELRGMIVDTNKAMSKVEVSSTKAVDLVESVHPEKLMIEVRRQDGKVESLRAAIESNEAIMKDLMLELKKMRDKMNFYKGIEQVINLNEEIKQELATIKKVEATIERHADKVETIFVEVEKKFSDFDKFNDITKDLDKSFKRLTGDFEKIRTKTEMKLERKEFVDMLDRFNEFEKHTTNLLRLLDERNKSVKDELHAQFRALVKQYQKRLDSMQPKPLKDIEQKIRTEVEAEQKPDDVSGEDSAGSDVKTGGMFSRIGGLFKKNEEEEEQPEMFEEDPLVESEKEDESSEELKKMEEARKASDEKKEAHDEAKETDLVENQAELNQEEPSQTPDEESGDSDKPPVDTPQPSGKPSEAPPIHEFHDSEDKDAEEIRKAEEEARKQKDES